MEESSEIVQTRSEIGLICAGCYDGDQIVSLGEDRYQCLDCTYAFNPKDEQCNVHNTTGQNIKEGKDLTTPDCKICITILNNYRVIIKLILNESGTFHPVGKIGIFMKNAYESSLPIEEPFLVHAKEFIDKCFDIMKTKGRDYSSKDDRFKSIKNLSERTGIPVEKCFGILLLKNIDAIFTWIKEGKLHSEPIEERIADTINYLLLIEGWIHEQGNLLHSNESN